MKKRLVLFGYSLGSGGAERVLANLANYWARTGHEVAVVTLAAPGSDFYALDASIARIELDLAGDSGSALDAVVQNSRRVRALRRVLRDARPDVAVAFTTTMNVLLALASAGAPWAAVGSEHVHPPRFPLGRPWELLRSRLYGRLDAVTVLTPEMGDWVLENTSCRRVRMIPNPVWPLEEHEPRVDPHAVVPEPYKLLLAVGRLAPQKGFDLLLEAFSASAARHADWKLVIAGEGPERPALERRIRDLGIGEQVAMPGVLGNIEAWYRRADIYVMSSRFEGFGNTLAEAACVGMAVVSFDCETGPATIVRHGVNGVLVPPEDVEALAAALDDLMSDEALRRRLGANAAEAREAFSIAAVAGKWAAMFDDLLGHARAVTASNGSG